MKGLTEAPIKETEDICANTNESDKSWSNMMADIEEVLKEYLSKD